MIGMKEDEIEKRRIKSDQSDSQQMTDKMHVHEMRNRKEERRKID